MLKAIKFMVYLIVSALIGFMLLVTILGYFYQDKLLFHPTRLSADHQFTFEIPFEEQHFVMDDGINLHGILFPAPDSEGLIFYLHGNAGSLENWGRIAPHYADLPYDLFILDYRGFGKSGGEIKSEEQFFEDVRTVYRHFIKMYGEDNIIVIGYSIGSAPATMLGASFNPAKIILKAPFFNLRDIKKRYYPYIPNLALRYSFENNEYLSNTTSQVIIYHGTNDGLIPSASSELLRPMLKSGDHYILLADQDHNGMNRNPDYHQSLREMVLK
jgi:uncharacterized protein